MLKSLNVRICKTRKATHKSIPHFCRYNNNGCNITKLGLCSKSYGSSFNLSDYFVTLDLQGV